MNLTGIRQRPSKGFTSIRCLRRRIQLRIHLSKKRPRTNHVTRNHFQSYCTATATTRRKQLNHRGKTTRKLTNFKTDLGTEIRIGGIYTKNLRKSQLGQGERNIPNPSRAIHFLLYASSTRLQVIPGHSGRSSKVSRSKGG